MPTITIDDKKVEFENGMTVMQACELVGAETVSYTHLTLPTKRIV